MSGRVFRQRVAEPTLACDEGDELAHALLHAFFRFFGDFGVFGQGHLHDTRDWSKVANVSVRVFQRLGWRQRLWYGVMMVDGVKLGS